MSRWFALQTRLRGEANLDRLHSGHSPSRVGALTSTGTSSPRRRVLSKVARTPVVATTVSPLRSRRTSIVEPPTATPPQQPSSSFLASPVSPPRQHARNLGPPGTESPRTKRRHSRVLIDVTFTGGSVQQSQSVGVVKKTGGKKVGGERREQQLGKLLPPVEASSCGSAFAN